MLLGKYTMTFSTSVYIYVREIPIKIASLHGTYLFFLIGDYFSKRVFESEEKKMLTSEDFSLRVVVCVLVGDFLYCIE